MPKQNTANSTPAKKVSSPQGMRGADKVSLCGQSMKGAAREADRWLMGETDLP